MTFIIALPHLLYDHLLQLQMLPIKALSHGRLPTPLSSRGGVSFNRVEDRSGYHMTCSWDTVGPHYDHHVTLVDLVL